MARCARNVEEIKKVKEMNTPKAVAEELLALMRDKEEIRIALVENWEHPWLKKTGLRTTRAKYGF